MFNKDGILVFYSFGLPVHKINSGLINANARILELLEDNYNLYLGVFMQENRVKKFTDIDFKNIFNLNNPNKVEKNWSLYFKYLENIIKENNIKKIVTIGTVMQFITDNKNFKFCNNHEYNIEKMFNKIKDNDLTNTSFVSTYNILVKVISLYYISNVLNIPVVQFIYDPLECVYNVINKNNKSFYFYDSEKLKNIDGYFPYIEYEYYYKKYNNIINKDINFLIGFSTANNRLEYRYKFLQYIKEFNDDKNKILYEDKVENINTLVYKEDYLKLLNRSKYTFILPSYDDKEFSLIRFHESITNHCIPLIDEKSNWKQAFTHLKSYKEIIEKYNLIINYENIFNKIKELDYDKIINEFIESKDFKNYLDIKFYINYLKQIF